MHSLFFPSPFTHSNTAKAAPHSDADIYENETAFWMELAVPGFDKDDFTISASQHQLVLKAERQRQIPEEFSKIQEGSLNTKWERTFRFKQTIDAESVEALVTNGVLTLTIPKKTQEFLVSVQAR